MTWKAVVTTFGMLLLAPSVALGDGGPVAPVQGGAGIAAPGGAVRFIASPAGRNTVIKRVTARTRRVQATLRLSGSYGIPGADYSGTLTGLSADGRMLILEQLQTSYPVRATRLLVLATGRMRIERRIVLPGWSVVDAISPDGRWMYLIHYSSTANAFRYEVLAYDLVQGRLLKKPIVDPNDREGPMTGLPMARVMSPGGRWAYTLYYRPSGVPFVHALDTTDRRAVCVDLPSLRGLGFNEAKLLLGPGAKTLQVKFKDSIAATINTRTFAVSTGGPLSAVLPPGPGLHSARTGSDAADGGGGGASLPWELAFVPIAAVAVGAGAVWRGARPRAAEWFLRRGVRSAEVALTAVSVTKPRSLGLVVARREVWSASGPRLEHRVASLLVAYISRLRARTLRGRRALNRVELLSRALYLSMASVCAGALIGTLSVAVGLVEASVAVLASGLGLLADLAGSVVLVWRFHAERRHPVHAERAERRAAAVIVVALALVSTVVAADAIRALVDQEAPGGSWLSLAAAGIALVVLPPLALAKRRTAAGLGSHALRGDSSITAIGAATALIALVGLALFHAFGWWWADRVAALLVAAVAASESYDVLRGVQAGELD